MKKTETREQKIKRLERSYVRNLVRQTIKEYLRTEENKKETIPRFPPAASYRRGGGPLCTDWCGDSCNGESGIDYCGRPGCPDNKI